YANGIHALDLLRFFGGEVEAVQAVHARYENDFPDCHTAMIRFAGGGQGRALVDYVAPGNHRFELRCIGARATSTPGLGRTVLSVVVQRGEALGPDADDVKYKAGFWKKDPAFRSGVREGRQPPFPAVSLADALGTMRMIDQICGLPASAAALR